MSFELFIARRFLKSKHRITLVNTISKISTLGVAIGVAVLVIVISVFNGFGSIVQGVLNDFDPHLRIILKNESSYSKVESLRNDLFNSVEVSEYQPFIEGKVIVIKKNLTSVMNLIANDFVSTLRFKPFIMENYVKQDSLEFLKNLLISFPSKINFSVVKGDSIEILSFNGLENTIFGFTIPETKIIRIGGIFETNNKDYDGYNIYTGLEKGKELLGMNEITGIDVRLKDKGISEKIKNILDKKYEDYFDIQTWYYLHKDLYNIMKLERWIAFLIVSLIILIAAFNILGTLIMTVMEKTRDLSILKALGAKSKSIRKIFFIKGMIIGSRGVLSGLIIGILICLIQINFNIYPLDASKFIIDYLPVKILISDIIIITILTFIIVLLSAYYPAKNASQIEITDVFYKENN